MRQRRAHRGIARSERGASAVEFALVVPILTALVLGIITFGFIFATQISMNSAVRDAARAGVVRSLDSDALTCAAIATTARDGTNPLGGSPVSVAVSVTGPDGTSCALAAGTTTVSGAGATLYPCQGSDSQPTSLLTVRLTYTASAPFKLPYAPGSDNMPLKAKGAFQCEYS